MRGRYINSLLLMSIKRKFSKYTEHTSWNISDIRWLFCSILGHPFLLIYWARRVFHVLQVVKMATHQTKITVKGTQTPYRIEIACVVD